jgi:hypothetical protein
MIGRRAGLDGLIHLLTCAWHVQPAVLAVPASVHDRPLSASSAMLKIADFLRYESVKNT